MRFFDIEPPRWLAHSVPIQPHPAVNDAGSRRACWIRLHSGSVRAWPPASAGLQQEGNLGVVLCRAVPGFRGSQCGGSGSRVAVEEGFSLGIGVGRYLADRLIVGADIEWLAPDYTATLIDDTQFGHELTQMNVHFKGPWCFLGGRDGRRRHRQPDAGRGRHRHRPGNTIYRQHQQGNAASSGKRKANYPTGTETKWSGK
jgi:hypothetical protein